MITSDTRTAGPYTGNGVTDEFAFAFKIFEASDILVIIDDEEVELDTDYTVTINEDQDTSPGGIVTTTSPLADGSVLELESNVPYTQEVEFPSDVYARVLNDALDRLTILIQQVRAGLVADVTGEKGWSPRLAVVADSTRRVLQVASWTGGEGTPPTSGLYLGASGLTAVLADAVDIRGAAGLNGNGTGDLIAANNLSDLASAATARNNLGLGTAATKTSGVANSGDLPTRADADTRYTPEYMILAVSDETTVIEAGAGKLTFRMPFGMTVTAVRASLATASTAGVVTVDINEGGVSILSTKLTIDQGEKTSTTAAAAAVISDTTLADDAEITVDIDGAGADAVGLKVTLIGRRIIP